MHAASTRNNERVIRHRQLELSRRSRFVLGMMRTFIRPMLSSPETPRVKDIAKRQRQIKSMKWPSLRGHAIVSHSVGEVPCHTWGPLEDSDRPIVLWLHGGAFILPAAPQFHFSAMAKVCNKLGASGVMPDYRLAPQYRYPAALDDCEAVYRDLLQRGFSANKIVLIGDSAGGNLLLGLLQRLREAELPYPCCGTPLSPLTDMARTQNPSRRYLQRIRDPLLPVSSLPHMMDIYCPNQDTSNPEISPLFMDCRGLPPLFFIASSSEILVDDTVEMAQRCHAVGVTVKCDIWPHLPHVFPVFYRILPEAKEALRDVAAFAKEQLAAAQQRD